MNIVQEEERRVAGRAPKVAKPRRKGAHSIPRWAYVVFAVLAVLVLLRSFQQGIGTSGTAQAPVRPVTVAKVVAKDVPLYLDEIGTDRKSTRLNSSHRCISYAVFCLK